MPLALLLGLKKESIGACYSINRDSNLGLTTYIFGPDAPETKGTFAVYIVGSVIGTVFISILASVVASWNIFDPIALGMASGVGSGSMMTADKYCSDYKTYDINSKGSFCLRSVRSKNICS